MRRRHTFLRCGVEAQFWCEMRIEDAIWAAEIRATLDGCCTKLGLGGSDRLPLRCPFASLLQVSRGELRVSFAADVLQSSTVRYVFKLTRGVQKVRSLQTVNYEIRSSYLVTCNWNALDPAFLQRSDTVVEELLFVPGLQASHLSCNTNTNVEYGGWRSSSKPAFWMAARAWADLWSDALCWLQVTSVFS